MSLRVAANPPAGRQVTLTLPDPTAMMLQVGSVSTVVSPIALHFPDYTTTPFNVTTDGVVVG